MVKKWAPYLVAIIALSVGWLWASGSWWADVSRDPQSISVLDCDPIETSKLILKNERVPAATLYRYGARREASDQISPEVWNQSIMGSSTRFDLKPFRRGLYGSEDLDSADHFSSKDFDGITEIRLKPECLLSERVETIWGLSVNPRFQKWYKGHRFSFSLNDWTKTCFNPDGNPVSSQFKLYDSEHLDETVCEKITNQYFKEMNFAFVQDQAISRSWAIRDRECIQHLENHNSYWAEAFMTNSKLWLNQCDRFVNHRNRTRAWLKSIILNDDEVPGKPFLSKTISGTLAPTATMNFEIGDLDEFAVQGYAAAFDAARERCFDARGMKEFKQRLQKIIDAIESLQTIDVKNELDRACH